jgi:hypothetical protein
MPGFMPGIHVFVTISSEDVDGRDKPGHDVNSALWIASRVPDAAQHHERAPCSPDPSVEDMAEDAGDRGSRVGSAALHAAAPGNERP